MCIYYASSYAGIIAHAKSENGNQFLGDRKILRPLCSVSYHYRYIIQSPQHGLKMLLMMLMMITNYCMVMQIDRLIMNLLLDDICISLTDCILGIIYIACL